MPETNSKLDVWHFEYWDQEEQERRLIVAFDKWADKGVWFTAAQKVIHQEQLKHVGNGCLEHNIKGIRADGSRIEGSHKGWNSLQHAQPSGIIMLSALGNDFVLHRNVRVAFSRSHMTPFIKSTHSSHHLQLCDHIAKLHNMLQQQNPSCELLVLPELDVVESGETFGLVVSDHIATFRGLLVKEDIEDGLTGINNSTISAGINNLTISTGINNSDIPPSTSSISASINNSVIPSAGQTPSQCLFSIATSIDPRSLARQDSDEFYLFMDMRAEFKWLSYQMTLKCWVLATEEYNLHLVKKKGESVVRKNPQALLHALDNIEPKLMNKIIKDDYPCE
ncbi:hypothetical protein BDR03DRAFT_934430 [Suillus americanus]|nr:hypothetical protein BDR03DRAFT_934430 [Suillus americanus]